MLTSVNAPESVAEGARLDVRVKAIAPRGMASVTVRYRRAIVSTSSRCVSPEPAAGNSITAAD